MPPYPVEQRTAVIGQCIAAPGGVRIGAEAGMPVLINHIKATGASQFGASARALALIDSATGAEILRLIQDLHERLNATVLIVGQRVSTIAQADQILVLEYGRAVGLGRHEALLESCETYREIVASQITKEAAA